MPQQQPGPVQPPVSIDDLKRGGFHDVLGYRQTEWCEGRAVLELEIKPHHINMAGVVHGGVLVSLLDVACAQAGLYCPYPGRMRKALTLSLASTFTGQASSGLIRAVGTLRAAGTRIYNSTGEIFSEDGRLLALGEGTFRMRSGSEKPDGVPI
jgi:uncharacterized protein (TIGR00369 family)